MIIKSLAAALAILLLAGCAQIERGIDIATERGAKLLAQGIAGQCERALPARQKAYQTYLRHQRAVSPKAKMLPLDCDGDDAPDFAPSE